MKQRTNLTVLHSIVLMVTFTGLSTYGIAQDEATEFGAIALDQESIRAFVESGAKLGRFVKGKDCLWKFMPGRAEHDQMVGFRWHSNSANFKIDFRSLPELNAPFGIEIVLNKPKGFEGDESTYNAVEGQALDGIELQTNLDLISLTASQLEADALAGVELLPRLSKVQIQAGRIETSNLEILEDSRKLTTLSIPTQSISFLSQSLLSRLRSLSIDDCLAQMSRSEVSELFQDNRKKILINLRILSKDKTLQELRLKTQESLEFDLAMFSQLRLFVVDDEIYKGQLALPDEKFGSVTKVLPSIARKPPGSKPSESYNVPPARNSSDPLRWGSLIRSIEQNRDDNKKARLQLAPYYARGGNFEVARELCDHCTGESDLNACLAIIRGYELLKAKMPVESIDFFLAALSSKLVSNLAVEEILKLATGLRFARVETNTDLKSESGAVTKVLQGTILRVASESDGEINAILAVGETKETGQIKTSDLVFDKIYIQLDQTVHR